MDNSTSNGFHFFHLAIKNLLVMSLHSMSLKWIFWVAYNRRSLCSMDFVVAYKTEFLWCGFGCLWMVMISICCLPEFCFLLLLFAFLAVQTFSIADKLWWMLLRDCSFHGKRIFIFYFCWITWVLLYSCRSHVVFIIFHRIIVMAPLFFLSICLFIFCQTQKHFADLCDSYGYFLISEALGT